MVITLSEQELKHYGVLGMKWGVRKNRKSKLDRDIKRNSSDGFKSEMKFLKLYEKGDMTSDKKKRNKLYSESAKYEAKSRKSYERADSLRNIKRFFSEGEVIMQLSRAKASLLDYYKNSDLNPTKAEREYMAELDREIHHRREIQAACFNRISVIDISKQSDVIENGRKILEKYSDVPLDADLIGDFLINNIN